jgi:hypothetical protein
MPIPVDEDNTRSEMAIGVELTALHALFSM